MNLLNVFRLIFVKWIGMIWALFCVGLLMVVWFFKSIEPTFFVTWSLLFINAIGITAYFVCVGNWRIKIFGIFSFVLFIFTLAVTLASMMGD